MGQNLLSVKSLFSLMENRLFLEPNTHLSSFISRIAASLNVSSFSTHPPGNSQPLVESFFKSTLF